MSRTFLLFIFIFVATPVFAQSGKPNLQDWLREARFHGFKGREWLNIDPHSLPDREPMWQERPNGGLHAKDQITKQGEQLLSGRELIARERQLIQKVDSRTKQAKDKARAEIKLNRLRPETSSMVQRLIQIDPKGTYRWLEELHEAEPVATHGFIDVWRFQLAFTKGWSCPYNDKLPQLQRKLEAMATQRRPSRLAFDAFDALSCLDDKALEERLVMLLPRVPHGFSRCLQRQFNRYFAILTRLLKRCQDKPWRVIEQCLEGWSAQNAQQMKLVIPLYRQHYAQFSKRFKYQFNNQIARIAGVIGRGFLLDLVRKGLGKDSQVISLLAEKFFEGNLVYHHPSILQFATQRLRRWQKSAKSSSPMVLTFEEALSLQRIGHWRRASPQVYCQALEAYLRRQMSQPGSLEWSGLSSGDQQCDLGAMVPHGFLSESVVNAIVDRSEELMASEKRLAIELRRTVFHCFKGRAWDLLMQRLRAGQLRTVSYFRAIFSSRSGLQKRASKYSWIQSETSLEAALAALLIQDAERLRVHLSRGSDDLRRLVIRIAALSAWPDLVPSAARYLKSKNEELRETCEFYLKMVDTIEAADILRRHQGRPLSMLGRSFGNDSWSKPIIRELVSDPSISEVIAWNTSQDRRSTTRIVVRKQGVTLQFEDEVTPELKMTRELPWNEWRAFRRWLDQLKLWQRPDCAVLGRHDASTRVLLLNRRIGRHFKIDDRLRAGPSKATNLRARIIEDRVYRSLLLSLDHFRFHKALSYRVPRLKNIPQAKLEFASAKVIVENLEGDSNNSLNLTLRDRFKSVDDTGRRSEYRFAYQQRALCRGRLGRATWFSLRHPMHRHGLRGAAPPSIFKTEYKGGFIDYGRLQEGDHSLFGLWYAKNTEPVNLLVSGVLRFPLVNQDGIVLCQREHWPLENSKSVKQFLLVSIMNRAQKIVGETSSETLVPLYSVPDLNGFIAGEWPDKSYGAFLKTPELTAAKRWFFIHAKTGAVRSLKASAEIFQHAVDRPLQPAGSKDVVWAAWPNKARTLTRVGLFNMNTQSFVEKRRFPGLVFTSRRMWVRPSEKRIYVALAGALVSLPL